MYTERPTKKLTVSFFVVPTLLLASGCATGHYAQNGTLGGGLAGGAIGALAGAHSDRSLEGVAIGAVTGGLIGNAAGNLADRDVAIANTQQAVYQQQARNQAVTTNQVVQMAQSGVGDQLIINQMQTNGVLAPLTTNDMISLKRNGVSDNVITAWQQSQVAGAPTRVSRAAPIVVTPVYDDYRYYPSRHCPWDVPCHY